VIILVTGGAGFVGSSLALHFKRSRIGDRVVALDNLHRRGSELNLSRIRAGGVEFIHADIRNPEDLDCGIAADVVIECSAEPSVLAGLDSSPQYVLNTNLVGTLHVLEYCRRHRARLVFLSTSRVYPIEALCAVRLEEAASRFEIAAQQETPGLSTRGIAETFPLTGARSIYGATKLASELLIEEYGYAYGVEAIVDRCGVLAGPWQMGKVDQGFVTLWIAQHVYGGALRYIGFNGSGKQVRDVLHVDDLCELVVLQMERFDALRGETFNVGGGRRVSVSLLEMTSLCQDATGVAIPIQPVLEGRRADVPLYVSDTTKIHDATGWSPGRGVEVLVKDTYAWICEHRAALATILGR
jgi:CDP-paratose 2-epimerase